MKTFLIVLLFISSCFSSKPKEKQARQSFNDTVIYSESNSDSGKVFEGSAGVIMAPDFTPEQEQWLVMVDSLYGAKIDSLQRIIDLMESEQNARP